MVKRGSAVERERESEREWVISAEAENPRGPRRPRARERREEPGVGSVSVR